MAKVNNIAFNKSIFFINMHIRCFVLTKLKFGNPKNSGSFS